MIDYMNLTLRNISKNHVKLYKEIGKITYIEMYLELCAKLVKML